MNVRQRLFQVAAIAVVTLLTAGVGDQEARDAESELKKVEAKAREKEAALKQMADQLDAQRAEIEAQRSALASQRAALQKEFKERLKQSDDKGQAYQQMLDLFGERRTNASADATEFLKMQQLEAARHQLAQLEALKSRKAVPLPENAETKVFALRHSKLPEVSRVLAEIVGDRGLRLAADERTNSLIVSADQNTIAIAEALLQRLDVPQGRTPSEAPFETLQLRIMWLVEGVEGQVPNDSQVSPQVLEALKQLGLKDPAVVCQQVTTLTLGEDNRRGQFQFAVPVVINGRLWQLDGNGMVWPSASERLALQFELQFARTDASDRINQLRARLGGSIYSPLGHYTVMGTSMLVDVEEPEQHLSAFVVHLDRAPDFPVSKPAEAPPRR